MIRVVIELTALVAFGVMLAAWGAILGPIAF